MKPSARPKAIQFLNAAAFGTIAPLLFYMIPLPFSKWIGLLFVVDALGMIVGRLLIGPVDGVSNDLSRRMLLSSQLLCAIAYAMLCPLGHRHIHAPLPQTLAFALIYISRFVSAAAMVIFPNVRLITPNLPLSRSVGSASVSMWGFAGGCAVTAAISNTARVPASILITGGFQIPAILAVLLSLVAAAICWRTANLCNPFQVSGPLRFFPTSIILLSEVAFAMTLCVFPLTNREICAFTPALTAMFLGFMALLSAIATLVARRVISSTHHQAIVLNCGIISASFGFAGFATALWLSWKFEFQHGSQIAFWVTWIMGVPAAFGHGLLRESLLCWLLDPVASATFSPGPPWIRLATECTIVAIAAVAAFANSTLLWEKHERSSLAIPAILMLGALPLGVLNWRRNHRHRRELSLL